MHDWKLHLVAGQNMRLIVAGMLYLLLSSFCPKGYMNTSIPLALSHDPYSTQHKRPLSASDSSLNNNIGFPDDQNKRDMPLNQSYTILLLIMWN